MTTDDARDLLALIHLFGDLSEAAPAEGEQGSPMTAERLRAAAVTIEAEIRARLGLPVPGPDDDPRDLLNLSVQVDSTAGCPVADQCAVCGRRDDLRAALATTGVGIRCLTLCWECESNCAEIPAPDSLDAAYALVVWHAGHIGLELPHLNGRYPGCPKCTRLHFPWCHPYGGTGYAAARAGEGR